METVEAFISSFGLNGSHISWGGVVHMLIACRISFVHHSVVLSKRYIDESWGQRGDRDTRQMQDVWG